MNENYKHTEITEQILKAYYKVFNALGYGFLEKVYERAMMIELDNLDLCVNSQVPITVYYEGVEIGNYYADILVEDRVIVELKAVESICAEHEVQLVNYLKATNIEVGLLLNFGKKPEFKRRVFSNNINHNKS